MDKFGNTSSKFDWKGDYTSVPDTNFDFNMDGGQDFELWFFVDKDGRIHVEVKIDQPTNVRGWLLLIVRKISSFFNLDF